MNIIVILIYCYVGFFLNLGVLGVNYCEVHTTCSKCVKYPYCRWCSSDDYKDVRCKPITENFTGCAQIEMPRGFVNVKEDRNFSSSPNVTQIRPQVFDITLRLEESQEFNITFKAAEDYPADLYFLIDASYSMTSVLKSVATASAKITDAMRVVTKNVFLGMGTFIDKNTAPFVRARDPNAETYSFRHRVSMTSDVDVFQKTVSNTPVGTNYDDPEGGFDALAQVMKCKEEIGWREISRKIIFFFTDQLCHSAGDGKWGGIARPYDGQCYTKDGKYTKELEMDYPSTGMLNKLSADEEVTIVFIVEQSLRREYEHLAKTSERWKYLTFYKVNEVVTFDNHELAQLISSIYEEISHTVKLKTNMAADLQNDIEFKFTPDCYKKGKTNPECKVKKDVEMTFKGNVTLKKHFQRDNAIVNLTIQGIKERVVLNLKVVDCECGLKAVPKSALCSYRGVRNCGVCDCDVDRTGKKCECAKNGNTVHIDTDSCKPPNSTALACNGFGACVCGICECIEGREGRYCQCDNHSCPKKCSGNGECRCGKCECGAGWEGAACDCRRKPCKEAHGKKCNDRGSCTCGKCICENPAVWDARVTQTDACAMIQCKYCHTEQCLKLKDCALCYQKNSRGDCSSVCDSRIQVNLKESLANASEIDGSVCEQVPADLGCYTRFQYKYIDEEYGVAITVESQPECLKSYYWIGGSFLLTMLIIGLLTLGGWKVLTDLRDRREYNRFLKSTQEGDAVCDNPIYEPASTTFRNPVFKREE